MYITDNEGKQIKVTDLAAAIEQAKLFNGYIHNDPIFREFDKKQKIYWQDLLDKLNTLKTTDQSTQNHSL